MGLVFHQRAITLPSGLRLTYPQLEYHADPQHLEDGQWRYHNGRHWENLYGGKIIQGCVQSLARIVLSEALLDISRDLAEVGGRIAMTVHDEIVASVPQHLADIALARMIDRLRQPPAWVRAEDGILPLVWDAEGGHSARYDVK